MVRNSDSVPCYFFHSVTRKGCIRLPPSPAYFVASCSARLANARPLLLIKSPLAPGASGGVSIASYLVDPSSTAFTPVLKNKCPRPVSCPPNCRSPSRNS
ncbi:MAG: hypothetical protein QOF94_194 [Acidobacteriaceae bacterium]|jgi:hypothetical protein